MISIDTLTTDPRWLGTVSEAFFVALDYTYTGVGTLAWSITSGALPTGLALDTSTGAIGGTPTTAGAYTFTVLVTDGSESASQSFTSTIETGGPVQAFHTFASFTRVWYSFRTAGGTWLLSKLYAAANNVGASWSTGVEAPANIVHPRGAIGYGGVHGDVPYYYGQGQPAAAYPIVVDNLSFDTANIDYWDLSHGAWTINGHLWAMLRYGDGSHQLRIAMLKAITFDTDGIPTEWHAVDQANEPILFADRPSASIRWDGSSTTVDLFVQNNSASTWRLATFDCVAEAWAFTGSDDFGRTIYAGSQNGLFGNGIRRYANGDVGVVYSDGEFSNVDGSGLFYRLYASGAWGSEVPIATYAAGTLVGLGTMIPDPAGESLHVFAITHPSFGGTASGRYHIVEHAGTAHANLFSFPNRPTTDGFGHGITFDGNILVPWDDTSDTTASNSIWIAPITGGATTFVEEALPKPTIEAGEAPSCTYLIYSVGGGTLTYTYTGTGGIVFGGHAGSFRHVPPPSTLAIFPQYVKRHNLVGH